MSHAGSTEDPSIARSFQESAGIDSRLRTAMNIRSRCAPPARGPAGPRPVYFRETVAFTTPPFTLS